MEQLFNSLLVKTSNPPNAVVDHVEEPPKDVDMYGNDLYWVHISNQPWSTTRIVREVYAETLPKNCNNVVSHRKDLGMINVVFQWDDSSF